MDRVDPDIARASKDARERRWQNLYALISVLVTAAFFWMCWQMSSCQFEEKIHVEKSLERCQDRLDRALKGRD